MSIRAFDLYYKASPTPTTPVYSGDLIIISPNSGDFAHAVGKYLQQNGAGRSVTFVSDASDVPEGATGNLIWFSGWDREEVEPAASIKQLVAITKGIVAGDGLTFAAVVDGTGRNRATADAVAAFCRSMAAEHQGKFRRVIIGENTNQDAIARAIELGGSEDEIVVNGEGICIPRFREFDLCPAQISIDPEGIYLITGGLAGIGFEVSRWLRDKGARQIAVIGRSELDAHRTAKLEQLNSENCHTDYHQLDIGALDSTEQLEDLIERSSRRLAGVLHLASHWQEDGRTLIRSINETTDSDIDGVMGAKAYGALHISALLEHHTPDFTVFFSSASTALGAPIQATYAAANGVLDGIARSGVHSTITSIAWGPIGDVGFGATSSGKQLHQIWEMADISVLMASQMITAMESAIGSKRRTLAIVATKGENRIKLPWLQRRPVYAELGFILPQSHSVEQVSDRSSEASEIKNKVQTFLLSHLPETLQIPPEAISAKSVLNDIGVDSLIVLEVLFSIERELDISFAYNENMLDLSLSISEVADLVSSLATDDVEVI